MTRSTLSATRPQQALQTYLDALLQDAFADLEAVVDDEFQRAVLEERQRDAGRLQPQVAVAEAAPRREPTRPVRTVVLPSVVLPATLAPAAVVADREPEQSEPALAIESPAPVAKSLGRPAWAEQPFECLLFDVAGLTLAVPLISLGSIYPLDVQELTPLFGQPDWFLGLLPCQAGNLRVIDTARWVLAERYREEFREGLQYVISIEGYEWGLAVHQVSRSIRLDPADVKWRGERSQRPWLAGTVIEHMCALLDVAALAELIAGSEKRS